jgi:hypothetical protein
MVIVEVCRRQLALLTWLDWLWRGGVYTKPVTSCMENNNQGCVVHSSCERNIAKAATAVIKVARGPHVMSCRFITCANTTK